MICLYAQMWIFFMQNLSKGLTLVCNERPAKILICHHLYWTSSAASCTISECNGLTEEGIYLEGVFEASLTNLKTESRDTAGASCTLLLSK
jgi:hypothetical protein